MAVPKADLALIHFGFDKRLRQFVINPQGERATAACRSIRGVEFNRRDRKFYLHEMFWWDLEFFCKKVLKMVPPVLKEFAAKAHPTPDDILPTFPTGESLRDYQQVGAGILTSLGGGFLCDDMGTGKTVQTLAAYYHLKSQGVVQGMIVVGPNSVLGQWGDEAEKFIGEGAYPLDGPLSVDGMPSEGIITISYHKTYRDPYQEALLRLLRRGNWVLVFDEAHKAGAEGTQTHAALRVMCHGQKYKWALTGTEVRNQPDSYLAMYKLLTGSDIPTSSFNAYFMNTRGKWDRTKLSRIQKVRAQCGIRRTQEQVLDELPPLTEILHKVPMNKTQVQMLKAMENGEVIVKLLQDGGMELIENKGLLGEMTRAFQITSHPLLLGGDPKPTPKTEVLDDLIDGKGDQQAIVWSYHPETILWLKKRLEKKGHSVGVVYGGVSDKKRDQIRKDFWDGKYDILIANPQSYGEGVNLQCATLVIYWDQHWSKYLWEQSRKRAYRMGQTKPVSIHYLCHDNSIEIVAYDWVREKKELSDLMTGD